MTLVDLALCSAFALCLPAGQTLFKAAALRHAQLKGPLPMRFVRNYALMAAAAWYGLTALFWFYILTRVPLTQAYPYSIAGSALVPVFAHLIFREPLTRRFIAGYLMILAGMLVISA
jgi:drug/metabolite transporter (DMT)-like permease